MILLLDTTAKRYGVLPSRLLKEGDTLDIHVVNTATAWEQYQSQVASAKAQGKPEPAPHIPEDRLKGMVESVRRANVNKKST